MKIKRCPVCKAPDPIIRTAEKRFLFFKSRKYSVVCSCCGFAGKEKRSQRDAIIKWNEKFNKEGRR